METASERSDLSGQHGGEDRLLVAQGGGRVAAVHGDGRSLDGGNHERKPVDDVAEQLHPLLDAVDGRSHGATLEPVVVLVRPLCEQAAAVARPAPVALGAGGGRGGARSGQEGQKVQNLPAVHGLRSAVVLVDSDDEV